ncbi:unnamed protein product [Anisakis simplex]|uniref:WD_REPEATS_REGION domain-containing protein n=1 Tax=Anisakis simplex TaxID=6269 RepID=A0A158PNC3_ANISI|nr:unnamed protein product [Anisakis simplex]
MNRRRLYEKGGVFAWVGNPGDDNQGLAVAEAAQQIDLSTDITHSFFDFISTKEIIHGKNQAAGRLKPSHSFDVDFKSVSLLIYCSCSVKRCFLSAVSFRLNSVGWSSLKTDEHPAGLLIGGGESGIVYVFDAASLIRGEKLNRVGDTRYHQGHVSSIDVNRANNKWVCSGGGYGSVLIWDMNSPLNPMSPGTSNYNNQIKCVQWNHFAEHILASLSNERCSIWDLRKPGSPILDVADIGNGVDWSVMRWNPNPANGNTLCLASQSDSLPILQKWDLRYASEPVLTYQLHSSVCRGVFGMDWSTYDSEILATLGRDEQILFQNPNNGQLIGRDVVKGTFHECLSHLSVSFLGLIFEGWPRHFSWNPSNPNLFAVSFFDRPIEIHSLTPFATDETQVCETKSDEFQLSVIPAWMRRGSCGAQFSYGSKLCTFEVQSDPATNTSSSVVFIKKIEQDESVEKRIEALQTAIDTNQLSIYCEWCAQQADNADEKVIWDILSKHSLNASRTEYLRLISNDAQKDSQVGEDLNELISQMDSCHMSPENDSEEENDTQNLLDDSEVFVNEQKPSQQWPNRNMTQMSLKESTPDDDSFLAMLSNDEPRKSVADAILKRDWTLALLLAHTNSDQDAVRFIARKLYEDPNSSFRIRLVALMAAGMWEHLLYSWEIVDWKKILLLILAQAPSHKIRSLCNRLCDRMLMENSAEYLLDAAIPAIICGDIEALMDATRSLKLDQRIALALILRHSLGSLSRVSFVGGGSSRTVSAGPKFQSTLEEYVKGIAEKGFIEAAWKMIEPIDNAECNEGLKALRYTLYNVIGSAFAMNQQRSLIPIDPYAKIREEYSKLNAVYQQPSSAPANRRLMPLAQQPSFMQPTTLPKFPQQPSTYPPQQTPLQNAAGLSSPYGAPQTLSNSYSSYPPSYSVQQPQSMMYPSPNQPPPIPGHPASAISNGYIPSPSMPQQSPSSCYQSNMCSPPYAQSTCIPPPNPSYPAAPSNPPMGPYGSLPTSAATARIRTISTASQSSTTAEGTSRQVVVGSPMARRMSTSSGWNDPPVIAAKKNEPHSAQIADIHFKMVPLNEGMPYGVNQLTATTNQQNVAPSETLNNSTQQPLASYTLSEADNYLITTIQNLIATIRQYNKTTIVTHKMSDVEHKVSTELIPRLARNNFCQETLSQLYRMAASMNTTDFRTCQQICTELVRGNDFVELSSVIPALKTLSSTALQLYGH